MPQRDCTETDTACTIETPEGVRLELYPAGPVARGGAWLVDSLIRTVIYIALALFLGVMGATGTGILLVSFFLLEWFYPVYFELTGARHRASPPLAWLFCTATVRPLDGRHR